jgi:thiamine biosynthesis lipoprotein
MKRLRRILLAACSLPAAVGAAEFRIGQPVMGTVLQITVVAESEPAARQAAEAGMAEARRWDDLLTTFRPTGELAQLNAAAGRGEVTVRAELLDALRRMQALSTSTAGAFDPTVGSLVAFFRQPLADAEVSPAFHSNGALRIGTRTVQLSAGVALDAGAVGKGMALDAIATLLRSRAVQAGFLDFGGSSQLALGGPPESPSGWRVAVAGLDPGSIRGIFALRRGSLSTSRATGIGAPEGPIIDPRSHRPVSERRVVTTWHNRATDADAWSTALIVMGRDGIDAAVRNGVEVFLEDDTGVAKTEGFRLEDSEDST